MKKISVTIFVVALTLGLVQCRKGFEEVIPYNNKAANIILDVGDGSKTDVNPLTGKVTFVDGDEIIVANDGVYVGKLVYDDGVFRGTVTGASTSDYLHFYHLGNRATGTLTEGSSTGCSVSVSDQVVSLPVISYAHSTEPFDGEGTYTARLNNKCALVKFEVSTSSRYAGVCVKGMNNTVVVDFSKKDADDAFSYEKSGDGNITMAPGNGEKWVILLPQDELSEGMSGSAFSGRYVGSRGAVPAIHSDDYLDGGISVTVDELTSPEGALTGEFTINSNGDKVCFSKSNLRYVINSKEWMFFDNQYGVVTTTNISIGSEYSSAIVVTHFGFGTSGYNHGAELYEPINTTYASNKYYVYGDAWRNLNDESGIADWGQNAITNGMNANRQWRTLTKNEWQYLISERPNAASKMGYATVVYNTYCGVVLLPDNWTDPYEDCFVSGNGNGFTTNEYNSSQWRQMEAAGAVFLPAAGRRSNTNIFGSKLFSVYWSSTISNSDNIYTMFFATEDQPKIRTDARCYGCLVRLVCE